MNYFNIMNELDIHDNWRIQNPDVHRFSWRGPGGKQSRLDYFLASSDFEAFIIKSEIGIAYRSDHSSVSICLQFNNQKREKGVWKLNNSLLSDFEYINKVKNVIKEVLNEYNLDSSDTETDFEDSSFSINYQLLWEMIKLKIRGMTISHTSYKKRQRDEQEREVEKSIQKKTEDYERSRDEKYKFEIDILQSKLQSIREIKIRGMVTDAKAKWRTEGEKCSRYFCNLRKRHYTEKIIPKLIS